MATQPISIRVTADTIRRFSFHGPRGLDKDSGALRFR